MEYTFEILLVVGTCKILVYLQTEMYMKMTTIKDYIGNETIVIDDLTIFTYRCEAMTISCV